MTLTGGAAKYRKRYGNYNVAEFLETGYLCISAVEDNKMKAFLVIGDAPPRCIRERRASIDCSSSPDPFRWLKRQRLLLLPSWGPLPALPALLPLPAWASAQPSFWAQPSSS